MKATKTISAILAAAFVCLPLFSCGDKTEDITYDYSKGLDKNGYFEGVKASDYVTLPKYKGVEMDKALLTASDEDLQVQLDSILAQYDTYEQITNRAVKDGDTVNIDYVGSVNGKEFDGGSTGGAGTDVTIGVTNYIDDFLEQLIGHKPGETVNVEVTFPTDYGVDELNGKDALFVTEINYIQGDVIKAKMTDEIAQGYGFDTKEAMIEDIKDWIIETQQFTFFQSILDEATCDNIPQSVLDYVIEYDLSQYQLYASLYGMSVEDYIVAQSEYNTIDEYKEANMDYYKADATYYLAAQAIAEIEGIVATTDDIAIAGYTDQIETYGEPYIKQYILFQTLLPEFVVGNAVVK